MSHQLSPNHPLQTDPHRPWPYLVAVGYRKPGARKIVCSRPLYIRATSEAGARMSAINKAREMMPRIMDGQRLIASRIVYSRPLDQGDAINSGGAA